LPGTEPALVASAQDLVHLARFTLRVDENLLSASRDELLSRTAADEGQGFREGYLLGVEEGPDMPTTQELDRWLQAELISQAATARASDYRLSFFKTSTGVPPEASEGVHFAGFHLDTHPELTSDRGFELSRILINLAGSPRLVRFASVTRYQLAERGIRVHRGDYQVVELPDDIETRLIEIPAPERGAIYALHFWASVVPHVGVDQPDGYFLASYEAPAPYPAPIISA
jgi:hypothetical protein